MNRTRATGGVALAALAVAVLAGCGTGGSVTRTEFTNKAGQHCTQVTRGSNGLALDCDYPPAENRIGDALNGLVNP